MNCSCPACDHYFRKGEKKQFLTWHLSRRLVPCPECGATLAWERKAHLRLWTGVWLVAIFDGLLFGSMFAPQIVSLLGGVATAPANNSYWNSWAVRATTTGALIFAIASFALMLSGFIKYRLIRHDVV